MHKDFHVKEGVFFSETTDRARHLKKTLCMFQSNYRVAVWCSLALQSEGAIIGFCLIRDGAINPLLTKLVRSRWLDIGQVLFLRVYERSINTHKKNAANIQLS